MASPKLDLSHLTKEFCVQAGREMAEEGQNLSYGRASKKLGLDHSYLSPSRQHGAAKSTKRKLKQAWLWMQDGYASVPRDDKQGKHSLEDARIAGSVLALWGEKFSSAALAVELGMARRSIYYHKPLIDAAKEAYTQVVKEGRYGADKEADKEHFLEVQNRCQVCNKETPQQELTKGENTLTMCPECWDEYQKYVALDERWKLGRAA